MITCDRCADPPAEAVQRVTCWYGCEHEQCATCATWTGAEASVPADPRPDPQWIETMTARALAEVETS